MRGTPTRIAEVDYPESDGKPMAETDLHREWMITIIKRLERFFADRRVYVSGNLLIYYQEGDPRKSVAPDAFVVKNCKPGRRNTFLIWREKRTPNFVMETTSKTTRREDHGKKNHIYAELGIAEYFLYDPLGDWLKPRLQGYRLVKGNYEPVPPSNDGSIISRELAIRFMLEGGDLAMFDAQTGVRLLSQEERTNEAEKRAQALEAELARLRDLSKKANGERRRNGK